MKLIEEHNPSLSGILSKAFHKMSRKIEDNNQILQ
jgi:hypothetical protein